jgi:hypothetical protein
VDRGSFFLSLFVAVFLIGVVGVILSYLLHYGKGTADRTVAVSNLRQTGAALAKYAADHYDFYPDAPWAGKPTPRTANQAFRRLFEGGYVEDERIFQIPKGAARADGDVSSPVRTLGKDENHWALAKGFLATSKANVPLVWEAPLAGHWNPVWDSSRKRSEWGSTWTDGSVLYLLNSGVVVQSHIEGAPREDKKGIGRLSPRQNTENPFVSIPNGDSLGPEW